MLGLWLLVLLAVFLRIVRAPRSVAWRLLAGLWAVFLLAHLLAPAGAAGFVGGSAGGWLVLGGLAALVFAYRTGLKRLRQRAAPAPAPPASAPDMMSDAELDRYARHIVLHEIGGPGQMALRRAKVLVIGAGGLGAPVCLYLAAAGVGRITLADDDTVSLSNLQRQVIFRDDLRGEPKAYAAAEAMLRLNPHLDVTPLLRRITEDDRDLIAQHDLVIDGTDSFAGRASINRACVAARVPLLSGAIGRWEGQLTLYDPARGAPCMSCIFPEAPERDAPCAEAGVVGALPGVIGSMMALEAIKHLTGAGESLRGRMVLFDGLSLEMRSFTAGRTPGCPVCGGLADERRDA